MGLNAHLMIEAELLVQRGGHWGRAGATRLKISRFYLLHFTTRGVQRLALKSDNNGDIISAAPISKHTNTPSNVPFLLHFLFLLSLHLIYCDMWAVIHVIIIKVTDVTCHT